jgi:hypothetical protein
MWRLCYPTQASDRKIVPAGWKFITVQGGYGSCFCSHGRNFITFRRDGGTNYIRLVISQGAECLCVAVARSGFKSCAESQLPADGQDEKILKEKESSGPYSTSGLCSAGVYVTTQKP